MESLNKNAGVDWLDPNLAKNSQKGQTFFAFSEHSQGSTELPSQQILLPANALDLPLTLNIEAVIAHGV